MYAVWLGKKDSEGNPHGVQALDQFPTVTEALECAAYLIKGMGASIIEGRNAVALIEDEARPCLMVHDLSLPFGVMVLDAQLTDTQTNDILPLGSSTETVSLMTPAEA